MGGRRFDDFDMPPLVEPPNHGYPRGFANNDRSPHMRPRDHFDDNGTPHPFGSRHHAPPPSDQGWGQDSMAQGQSWLGLNDGFVPAVQQGWPPQAVQAVPSFGAAPVFPPPQAMNMAGMVPPIWPGTAQPMATGPVGIITPMMVPAANLADFGQGDDDWVDVRSESDSYRSGGGVNPTWPGGFGNPRPMSRAASRSSRPHTPFSAHSSPSSRSSHSMSISRSRSKSYSNGPSWVPEHEKRPPRDWRPDFSMNKSAIGDAIGALFSPKKGGAPLSRHNSLANSRNTLVTYIRYTAHQSNMYLDLRVNPVSVQFRALEGKRVNEWDLTRFACEPPVENVVLYNKYYPWTITVDASNPSGVTLHDLFGSIWSHMTRPISQEDYWNNEVDEKVRERIAFAWAERCGGDENERSYGVRRVDFLMERVVLEGFEKGKDGMWEMKIKKK